NDRSANGAGERNLSTGERIAFQQIGERLKKESAAAADENAAGSTPAAGSEAKPTDVERPQGTEPVSDAGHIEPSTGERAEAGIEATGETLANADEIAELEALDGVAEAASP